MELNLNRKMMRLRLPAIAGIFIFGGVCMFPHASAQPVNKSPASPFRTFASIQELMDSTVDPAADGIWDSVAIISSRAGVNKREPHTPKEWQEVRRHAVTLFEAMNLVVMAGRHAAPPGAKPNFGELDPTQIDALIRANKSSFATFADEVRNSTLEAIAAIDKKDPQALMVAGGKIDQSCEGCHVSFWYPNSASPD